MADGPPLAGTVMPQAGALVTHERCVTGGGWGWLCCGGLWRVFGSWRIEHAQLHADVGMQDHFRGHPAKSALTEGVRISTFNATLGSIQGVHRCLNHRFHTIYLSLHGFYSHLSALQMKHPRRALNPCSPLERVASFLIQIPMRLDLWFPVCMADMGV